MIETPVEHLLQRIQTNDEDALVTLHERYVKLVYSVAYKVLGNAQDTEEITQDVFMRIWHKAETFDPEKGSFVPWLLTITRRQAIDRLRHNQRRTPEQPNISLDESPQLWETTASNDGISEVQMALLSALNHLSDDQRKAIQLAYFQGMSHSQIASALNKPLGTVKTYIRQGMEKLRLIWLADQERSGD